MPNELITNRVTIGMITISVIGAVALAGFTSTARGLQKEDKSLTILLSLVFLAMIGIVFSGFLDLSMLFAGTPDTRSEVSGAIRKVVGVACSVVFAFFLISLFILRSDPSKTQYFTSTMMYFSFLLSFISISVMALQNTGAAT